MEVDPLHQRLGPVKEAVAIPGTKLDTFAAGIQDVFLLPEIASPTETNGRVAAGREPQTEPIRDRVPAVSATLAISDFPSIQNERRKLEPVVAFG